MKIRTILVALVPILLGIVGYGLLRGLLRSGSSGGSSQPIGNSLEDIPALMAEYHVPGVSIAIIKDYEIDELLVYGVTNSDTQEPVTEETLFQAASISKSVTALGVARYVQVGAIDLDGDINNWLTSWEVPENSFTAQETVTLRRLLSHTAGTTVSGFDGYAHGEIIPTLLQVLNGEPPANSEPIVVDRTPGEGFKYSGGYVIVQHALIDLAHKPFGQVLQETVLGPLRMGDSTFEQPLPANRASHASAGHDANGNVLAGNYHIYPELAAAGLWTTPSDLAPFLIELRLSLRGESNKVIDQELVTELLAPAGDAGYGLGFRIWPMGNAKYFGHAGQNAGFVALMQADTETGVGAVVMTNADDGTAVVKAIMQIITKQEGWPGY
jgi:CubicO group peptidase (beta-lactamase class C family)